MRIYFYFFISLIIITVSCNQTETNQSNNIIETEFSSIEGFALGTTFLIKYEHKNGIDFSNEIYDLLNEFENSMSTFKENSVISKVNNNDTSVITDIYFKKCFSKALEISQKTDGAFDITVAPLVNAWGFGFTEKKEVNQDFIDSILSFVGFEKIKLENNKIIKENKKILLDASAIAKGQCVDVVSNYLIKKDVQNFLVEIGGEIYAKGTKENGVNWIIGIDKPIENSTIDNRELQEMIILKDKALATSGNYRQFYYKDGVKYSHTINPKTGYPVNHDLLSVTVLADDCITADAFATAFMVLGYEKSLKIINKEKNLEAYFILSGENDQYKIVYSNNFEKLIFKE